MTPRVATDRLMVLLNMVLCQSPRPTNTVLGARAGRRVVRTGARPRAEDRVHPTDARARSAVRVRSWAL